jgi:hypothetical protein
MKIGIIGRHPGMMDTALATAARLGHEVQGTLEDAQALAWLQDRAIQALVIGGGVEEPSRHQLLQACTQAGVQAMQVFGPGHLESQLVALS